MATKFAPTINRPRNKFRMPHEVGTTFDGGLVIPLEWQEILPGDHLAKKMSYIVRMLTPINPVMDNAYLNVSAYFVPYEIIWNQFKQFMGQNESTAWTESTTYLVPALYSSVPGKACDVGTIGDYLGLPTGSVIPGETRISVLPLRGYLSIWNYWYRNQNVCDPILFTKESADYVSASYGRNYNSAPLPSMKLPDYFTTCLPEPSKITPVELSPAVPVKTGSTWLGNSDSVPSAIRFGEANAQLDYSGEVNNKLIGTGAFVSKQGNNAVAVMSSSAGDGPGLSPVNLWTTAGNLTIETIRRAAVYQHIGEILARGGSRYASEFLVNIFGVKNSESLYDEPEFLGSIDKLINMTEVLSNSDTLSSTGETGRLLGSNGAMSKTTGSEYLFEHTFTRHGMVFVLATVRHRETYFQGLEKKWTRSSFFDFYLPQAQGLGYQKVLKQEIYSTDTSTGGANAKQVFGYQDYGAEYRFQPNRLTGYLKPNVTGALATWTYGQILAAAPTLNPSFMYADKSGFDRTIAVDSESYSSMQFFGNFLFDDEWIRVVGVQRFPGLDVI